MTAETDEISENTPVWARDDAFPAAPSGYGWADEKGSLHPCSNEEELVSLIRDDLRAEVALVWTPLHPRLIIPEELAAANEAIRIARKRRSSAEFTFFQNRLRHFSWILGGAAIWILAAAFLNAPRIATSFMDRAGFAIATLLRSHAAGLALLMFLIFAFIPWYQTRKNFQEAIREPNEEGETTRVLRFETWLQMQKAPVTWLIFSLIAIVGLVQMMPGDATTDGGLLRSAVASDEWWRLLTAPFLHGNPVHFAMNAAALLYLGKRVEVFARWQHLPLVFVFAALLGGEASLRFSSAPNSLGASGGLMGWLGFLLVFETLHARLVPRSSRRRLLAGVVLTALIGLIGYRYIDNAAHAGGLIAGMLYAAIVFPKSHSYRRPRSTVTDWIAGSAAMLGILGAVMLTLAKIIPW